MNIFKKCKTWIKKNKTALIVIGTITIAVVGGVILVKNNATEELFETSLDCKDKYGLDAMFSNVPEQHANIVGNNIKTYTLPQLPYDVSMHIRTMAENKHHSLEKAEEALKLGIELLPNQTLVDAYTKALKVA